MAQLDLPTGPVLLLALALTACESTPVVPSPEGVFVRTNATEYPVATPPHAALVTVQNLTRGTVTVRRCLINNSAIDPVGVDLVLEEEVRGAWQGEGLGFDCVAAGATRADTVLARGEAARVGRIIFTVPGRFRFRVGYGLGTNAAPTDTATSPAFVFR